MTCAPEEEPPGRAHRLLSVLRPGTATAAATAAAAAAAAGHGGSVAANDKICREKRGIERLLKLHLKNDLCAEEERRLGQYFAVRERPHL